MSDGPVPLETKSPDGPFWQRIPLIWLVPFAALAVTLFVAWTAYVNRGTLISITFEDATGIVPGQTQLRFREVHVGMVESTSFTEDLSRAIVNVRVNRDMERYIDSDAQFWLVRPEVSAQGISRLDTVLSGVFIEGHWDAQPGSPQSTFDGLQRAPASIQRVPGTVVKLKVMDAGGLSEGMPILYRGMTVGRVQNIRLEPGGAGVVADAHVDAPHDTLLTSETVFWDTSGFSVSVGADGLKLDVRSLAALVRGGVEFTTPVSGGTTVTPGASFQLFGSENEARDSMFAEQGGAPVHVAILMAETVAGLTQGAPVHFQGLPVGEVTNLSVVIETLPDGTRSPRQRAVLELSPGRMGMPAETDEQAFLDELGRSVEGGLRARAASTGIFGTSIVVELATVADAPPATLDRDADPFPILPTIASDISSGARTAEGMFARLSSLPIEDALNAATGFLNNASAFISSPELRGTPGAVRGLIDQAAGLIGSEQIQAVPQTLTQVLEEVRGLTADLRAAGIDQKLAQALEAATETAASIDSAAQGVPELISTVEEVARQAAAIRFEELGNRAAGIMAQLETIAGSSETRALPARLGETLAELSQLLAELRNGGAVAALNSTMQSAETAANNVAEVSSDLPALTARLDSVVRNLDTLISTYGERSTFSAETLSALRELRRAASSVGSLAQTIERNPRAFLTGR